MDFSTWWQKVLLHGLEYFNVFYGVYRGEVVDVADPEGRGRVRVKVPDAAINEASNLWIAPAGFFAAGRNRGWFWPPEVGDGVWVVMAQGRARYPLAYWGGWPGRANNESEVAQELRPSNGAAPRKRGFVLRRGHRLVFDETPGSDSIDLVWHRPSSDTDPQQTPARTGATARLSFTTDGGVELRDRAGNEVVLDPAGTVKVRDSVGNEYLSSSEGVRIDCGTRTFEVVAGTVNLRAAGPVNIGSGASHPVPMGDALLQWLNAHTHGTGVGPTTTPVQPAVPTQNSGSVKVKA